MDRLTLSTDCRDNADRREQFYRYVKAVFPGADFRTWYDRGFWFDRYIPHALLDRDRIVANVSVTVMTLLVEGAEVRGLQIGTVGTIPEYRGRGLSRRLMELVIERYEPQVDLMFLFANDEVVDFYPKFGFDAYNEVVFISDGTLTPRLGDTRRLDLNNPSDLALIRERLRRRQPLTRRFGAIDYDCITLWHLHNLFPEHIYYVTSDDVIVVASERNGVLNVWDVVFDHPFDLNRAVASVPAGADVRQVRYHFSPDLLEFRHDATELPEDSTLFVRGQFPLAERPFKFPFTAQT